jgi:hypothetical protein
LIKIRYSDLPNGLHVRADDQGRHTVIYLLPGLTPAQRRAALRRVRSSARMGCGPKMPAAGFAGAVVADRLWTTVRNGAGAMRAHPALLFPPLIIFVSAALAFFLLSSVSIRYQPAAVGPGSPLVPVAPGQVRTSVAGNPGSQPGGATAPGSTGRTVSPAPGKSSGKHPAGSGPSSPPGASPSPSASPTPAPGSSSPPPDQPAPGPPSAGPSPSPSPSGSGGDGGGVCVDVGPLGVCLHL